MVDKIKVVFCIHDRRLRFYIPPLSKPHLKSFNLEDSRGGREIERKKWEGRLNRCLEE